LVIGATTVYMNSQKSAQAEARQARLIEVAQAAWTALETDVVMANYWGSTNIGAAIVNRTLSPDPSATTEQYATSIADSCGESFAADVSRYIESASGATASHRICVGGASISPFTDTLTVRRAGLETEPNANVRQLCASRFDIAIVDDGNCSGALRDLVVRTYFVAPDSIGRSGYPSLRRHDANAGAGPSPAIEIATGVEDMQVELGWLSENGDAPFFTDAESTTAPSRIVAVRIWLLIRSDERDADFQDATTFAYGDRTVAPTDGYRRMLVSRTFFVRNATGS
jgi:type IV pilus assembly protein PilW